MGNIIYIYDIDNNWDLEDISDLENLLKKINELIKDYIDTNIIDDEDAQENKIEEIA